MRTADFQPSGTLRPDSGASAQQHGDHDTGPVRAIVSGNGRRSLRAGNSRMASIVPPPGSPDQPSGTVPGGGQRAPGPGSTDGSPFGSARRRQSSGGPVFDTPLKAKGYAWWYIDGLSDDGRHAITVIAFLGSVFSPF